jgi:hypothetical protein
MEGLGVAVRNVSGVGPISKLCHPGIEMCFVNRMNYEYSVSRVGVGSWETGSWCETLAVMRLAALVPCVAFPTSTSVCFWNTFQGLVRR